MMTEKNTTPELRELLDRLNSVLNVNATELFGCNGPVPRAVVDELVAAAEALVDAALAAGVVAR